MKIMVVEQRTAGDSTRWGLTVACGQLLAAWTLQLAGGADLWAEDPAPFFAAGISAQNAAEIVPAIQQCDQPLLILDAAMPLWTPQLAQQLLLAVEQYGQAVRMGDALCLPTHQLGALAALMHQLGLQALGAMPAAILPPQDEGALRVQCGRGYSHACTKLRQHIVDDHLANGVLMPDSARVLIDAQVVISPGATIYPDVLLQGHTSIARGTVIYPGCQLNNAQIGEDVVLRSSVLEDCIVKSRSTVGPFAYLRKGASIGQGVRIGDFVEVKNAVVGDNTSAAHLSYIGDATVGSGVNIGCGTVFCNYDGKHKHHTTIKDGAFIGSNANLVAPITVGEGAFVAAGSTVVRDVPSDALYVQRSEPVIREGWAAKRRQTMKE